MNTDLTKQAPRSPRVRLGGFAVLPRILDKCRAIVAGKNGEYKFNCPLDQRFFGFVQVDAEAFKAQVKKDKGDGEMLAWVIKTSKRKPEPFEITAWSRDQEERVPSDVESREYFHNLHKHYGPDREDIVTWFDLLDLDDYVSFGGKA
ncbi:MAG TPA: DUF5069 domain-containing protein [Verrucomicrobiae bacterium]|jgi:hypothetical protein|nr:DUF5069 domain-containing protein [Verrucomicrobiae bacterium]